MVDTALGVRKVRQEMEKRKAAGVKLLGWCNSTAKRVRNLHLFTLLEYIC